MFPIRLQQQNQVSHRRVMDVMFRVNFSGSGLCLERSQVRDMSSTVYDIASCKLDHVRHAQSVGDDVDWIVETGHITNDDQSKLVRLHAPYILYDVVDLFLEWNA